MTLKGTLINSFGVEGLAGRHTRSKIDSEWGNETTQNQWWRAKRKRNKWQSKEGKEKEKVNRTSGRRRRDIKYSIKWVNTKIKRAVLFITYSFLIFTSFGLTEM